MHKVILDTDPGIDDAMAIAFALAHPLIEVLALTTVFGNTSVDKTTRNAQYILEMFGAVDVDVARGAEVPLVQTPLPHSEHVHGEDGIGNTYPNTAVELNTAASHAQVHALPAAEYIVNEVRKQPGEITLIAVGPLTNIALALQLEPALPSMVKQLIVMGGTVDEPGNVTPLAEANFFNDPHAADQLLAEEWPMVVVGLDVTHQVMITNTHLAMLRDKAGKTGDFLWRSSRFYIDFYTQKGAAQTLAEPSCAMHDAAAIAYLVVNDAFTVQYGRSRVVNDGIAAGQLAIDRRGYGYATEYWQDRPAGNGACMQVDDTRVLNEFLNTIVEHHLS